MLKGIGLTALATAAAVLTLGCVRGLVSPTAPVQDQIYMTKPMSAPAGIIFERGHDSVARHRHLPRQWAAADDRPDVCGDVIRNKGRVRGRATGGDGQGGTIAGGADDGAAVGWDQVMGLGPAALHDVPLPLPACCHGPSTCPVDRTGGHLLGARRGRMVSER
jgi:hypothetical protein